MDAVSPDVVREVLLDFTTKGWAVRENGVLRFTEEGARQIVLIEMPCQVRDCPMTDDDHVKKILEMRIEDTQ